MAATVCVVIDSSTLSIGQLNSLLYTTNTPDKSKLVNAVIDLLAGAVGPGTLPASTIQVTVRDTDPSVATSGAGSTQAIVNVG